MYSCMCGGVHECIYVHECVFVHCVCICVCTYMCMYVFACDVSHDINVIQLQVDMPQQWCRYVLT